MNWSKEQETAINIRGKNILVSAAAGSGKTAVLVERIKQLIIKDKTEINEMLVVTFSNAAASELKERIIAALYHEIETNSESEEFLIKQLNKMGRANISTFHSFALEIIKRYFYLINLEPNFRICDDANRIILQNEAMEELFQKKFQAEDADFSIFLNKYAGSKNESEVKSMIQYTHGFIQSMPYPFEWLQQNVEKLAINDIESIDGTICSEIKVNTLRNLKKALRGFEKDIDILRDNGVDTLASKFEIEYELISNIYNEIISNENIGFDEIKNLLRNIIFERISTKKNEKEQYEQIKEVVTEIRDKSKKLISEGIINQYFQRSISEHAKINNMLYDVAKTLYSLVLEFDLVYKEKKTSKGLIDFSDIEHMALNILKEDKVANEYREKFKHIFIDEYQDSNLVQETLIEKIKRENNLFMVGDVKQSIYKFRLAEPEIFLKKYKNFKEQNNDLNIKIDLNQNFRSKGKIIEAVNYIFRRIMNEDSSEIDYDDNAALYKGSNYNGELDFYPSIKAVNTSIADDDKDLDEEIVEMKKAEIEANAAAQAIKDMLGEEYFDDKSGSVRKLEYRDIVILMRSAAGYKDVYSHVLNKENIPNYLDMDDGYFDTIEVGVFINLIRLIDNHMQDIPLLSVLRSAIFNFSIKELIDVRLMNKGISYHAAFSLFSKGDTANSTPEQRKLIEKCKDVMTKLDKWKYDSIYLSIEELLTMLIKETNYYDYLAALPNGFQRQANINALIDKAIVFQSFHMKGLFGFINYIDQLKKDKVVTGQVKLLSESDNLVRIMTVHKSKGLEFPAVIVSALGKQFNKDSFSGKINLHKDLGIGLRFVDEKESFYIKSINQTLIENRKEKEAMAEEMRILYVALTRAKDRLVLIGTVKNYSDTIEKLQNLDPEEAIDLKSFIEWLLVASIGSNIKKEAFDRKNIKASGAAKDQNGFDIHRLFVEGFQMKNDESIFELESEISKRLNFEYLDKGLSKLQSKFSVSEIKRLKNNIKFECSMDTTNINKSKECQVEFSRPKFLLGAKALTATDKGTIFHKVMEKIDYKIGNDREKVLEFINNLANDGFFDKDEAESINIDSIVNFFNSNIGKRASGSSEIFREASFILTKTAMDLELPGFENIEEKIIIQGSIDCYFKDIDGNYILIDFKTDQIRDRSEVGLNMIAEEYETQLKLYKEAIEKIRKVKIKEAYLYLFSINQEIKVNI
jgi:ATP-dependent helicase/nuclease subunit A